MNIHTFSSREFNQDVSRIKKASNSGPVFITDRGKPSYVLLNIQDYQNMIGQAHSMVELLAMDALNGEIEFEPVKMQPDSIKPADLA